MFRKKKKKYIDEKLLHISQHSRRFSSWSSQPRKPDQVGRVLVGVQRRLVSRRETAPFYCLSDQTTDLLCVTSSVYR